MTISIKGKKVVTKLKCKVYTKHKLRKHFSNKWIEGAGSIRTSNIRDHINADQHVHVMEIKNRAQGQPYCAYTFNLSRRVTYSMYIYGWPNNFLNGQILAEVFGRCPSTYFFLF